MLAMTVKRLSARGPPMNGRQAVKQRLLTTLACWWPARLVSVLLTAVATSQNAVSLLAL